MWRPLLLRRTSLGFDERVWELCQLAFSNKRHPKQLFNSEKHVQDSSGGLQFWTTAAVLSPKSGMKPTLAPCSGRSLKTVLDIQENHNRISIKQVL